MIHNMNKMEGKSGEVLADIVTISSCRESEESSNYVSLLKSLFKVEVRGTQIVTDEQKFEDCPWDACTMWMSVSLVFSAFALGVEGITVFQLTFWEAVLAITIFTFVAAVPVAFFSVFGAITGLRQMILSRFFIGVWGVRIYGVINCINCVGWGTLNTMSSAQLINIVNNNSCPPWAACLIIVVCVLLVSVLGYEYIHAYERWVWVPNLTVFLIIIARLKMSKNFTFGENSFKGGQTTAGNILSYGSALFGFTAGWSLSAADYTVYQTRSLNRSRHFLFVLLGLYIPTIFTFILGAACGTGTKSNKRWDDLYQDHSIAGIIWAVLVEDSLHGFGQFCCVLLSLTVIGGNLPNFYSVALTVQAFSSYLSKIPRILWSVIASSIALAISIPGFYYFDSIMSNFMALIGYALAMYTATIISEIFVTKRQSIEMYDWKMYKDSKAYPIGLASIFSFLCGIVGAVVGMSQVWYTGPIAVKIGQNGGDIGLQLAYAFSLISYLVFRPLEIKYIR